MVDEVILLHMIAMIAIIVTVVAEVAVAVESLGALIIVVCTH